MRGWRLGATALLFSVLSSGLACSKTTAPGNPPSAGPTAQSGSDAGAGAGAVREIAAGSEHTCARLVSGRVACWGSNARGQLGATTSQRCSIEDMLHGSGTHAYACSSKPLLVPGLEDAAHIVAGGEASCAKTTSGAVFCWGQNDNGLVGDGTSENRSAPARVALPAAADDVTMSDTHACARLVDGTVACWGVGFDGQLGSPIAARGDTSKLGELSVVTSTPTRVTGITGATEVYVGSRVTCIRTAADVSCFGLVALGDTGASHRIPRTAIPELAGATRIFLNDTTHCATFADGTSCWGGSSEGPLAKSNDKGFRWSKLVRSTYLASPRALAIVYGRACSVDTKGDVTCWGYDGRGASTPRKIEGISRTVGLAVGASHVCVLDEAGAVACWGSSASGQIDRVDPVHTSPLFAEPRPITFP